MRRLLRTKLTGALLGTALLVAVCGSALAYFSSEGLGTASAAVSKLTTPTITVATPAAGGTVALTWSAATAPGAEAVKYFVSRDGGEPAGTCAKEAAPAVATSCTDSGLAIGAHSYTVTAVWRSWSVTSATKTATVTIGPATHFTISAASATPAVSVADNLTITAKDENEATVTTFAGSHSLVFSGASASPGGTAATVANSSGTAVAFGSATALTFTAGVAAVTTTKNGILKVYRAGAANIAASEGALNTPAPLALTVSPGAATKYTLAAATATPAVGAADDLTITAQDAYGNTATTYTGSHNLVFSGASASPDGTLPTVSDSSGNDLAFGTATPIVFSAGIATATDDLNGEMTLYKSGATSVKATEGSLTNATALALTVAAGTATKLILVAATTTPVAAASDNLTTTARDAYENTATSYAGAKNIVFSGAAASPSGAAPTVANSAGTAISFGTATALTFTAGVATVSSTKNGVMKLNKVGAASVTATDGTISTLAPLAFTVTVGLASKLALTGVTSSAGSVSAACFFTCPVTLLGNSGTISAGVSVTDSVGNTVSELGSGHTVKVTATGGTVAGTPLTIAETGPAVAATQFTYTSPASGAFTNTITAATLAGTVYTSATATASK
ncbi:MAG TPA: hypothetical protein VGO36_05775 [Solirubrobacterales bacterium]|jgi:hypothetical protein|nr:hypothetical protein [Solirubrobacterales bacterium]